MTPLTEFRAIIRPHAADLLLVSRRRLCRRCCFSRGLLGGKGIHAVDRRRGQETHDELSLGLVVEKLVGGRRGSGD